MNPPETREAEISDAEIRAAGAVLWRQTAAGTEVALIHRPKYDDWTIPKGKLKKREHLLRAARREVREETGLRPLLGRRLSPSFYDKDGRPKRVDYWAATVDPTRPADPLPPEEVDRLEWLPIPEAARRLSYDRDARVLADFVDGPNATVPLILVRHAETAETGEASLRPLSPTGRARAAALSKLLACFGPATPIAALDTRSVETLLPHAIRTQTALATTPALTRPDRALPRWDQLLDKPEPSILCGDADLVAQLLRAACVRFGHPVPEPAEPDPAGFWVLHLSPDRIAAIEEHRPPRD